jgi:hypothetical protein
MPYAKRTVSQCQPALHENELVPWYHLERHGELNQKSKNDPNEIQLDGINQFNTPILSTT